MHKIPIVPTRLSEDLLQHVGDIVSTDDAAVSPDLNHLCEIDLPFVFLVCLVDDVDSLCKCC